MKKNFKRTLAKVMAVALTVSMVGVGSADADAASKKIKLSSKSISVVKGKTKKVTIKNVKAKKVKKLTVKSANKKIATVKKSGKTAIKVTGKKAGKSTKVTVKVTVGKKTTKLTLKVKVTKAKPKAPATKAPEASATPAASAAATPAASAAATAAPSAPTATKTPEASAPAATAPAATAPAATEPAATATTEPTAEPTYDPELADKVVALTAENATDWSKSGNYGTVVFNEDGTVSYSSQPTAIDEETGEVKAVSVYNNGLSFLLGADVEDKVDVTPYKYVSLRVKTDAEVKVMAWMGSDDANDFWSKNDTWGNVVSTVENSDGSKTLVYEVSTIFGKKANKAKAIGLTLKSPAADGTDSEPGVAQEATLYSIAFSNKIPEAIKEGESTPTPDDPQKPDVETVDMDITKLTADFKSDVEITTEDAATVIPFKQQYNAVFFDIPDDINLAQVTKVIVNANVTGQLSFTLYNNTLDKTTSKWWENKSYVGYATYPFYGGSCTNRDDKGGFGGEQGDETLTFEVPAAWALAGNGGYFAIGSNNEVKETSSFKIYSVQFVIDHRIDPIDKVVKPAEPTASAPTEAAPTASAPTEAAPTASAPTEAAPTASAPTEAAPTTPAEPDSKTVEIKIVAPETVAVEKSAEVSVKVVSDTATVETAVWEVETGNAEISVNKKDCTKATLVAGKKAGTVKVSVNVTLANGKTGKTTTTIQVVASDAEKPKDPVIETVALDITTTSKTMKSDVTPADGVFPYTKQYQSAFFDLPEDINLAQVTKVVIKADVANQISFTLWNNTLDQKADSWWSKERFQAFVEYPFYGGSRGEKTITYNIAPKWTVAGNGGYFSIGSNASDTKAGDLYKIISVELVIDHSKAKIDSVVEP